MGMESVTYTSRVAYRLALESGLIGKLHSRVVKFLMRNGPSTQSAVAAAYPGYKTDSIKPRFKELERMVLIERVGTTIDPETNVEVELWQATKRRPVAPPARWTKVEEERIACLEIALDVATDPTVPADRKVLEIVRQLRARVDELGPALEN